MGTAAVDLLSDVTDAVEDIFRSAGNAASDFINKYSDAAVAWAAGLNDTLRKQLIDGFRQTWSSGGGQFGGAGATGSWEEFSGGMSYAVGLGETADQKIILRPGSGPNPFDAAGGPGDVNATAPASIKENGTATFTIYLPYAAGEGGQRIRLQLTGSAAGAFDVVATSGAYPVGPDGTFDLLIHEGQKQITFALAELRDVDASETLGLNATLIGANDTPTHASHLEVNLSLAAVNEPTVVPPSGTISGTAAADFMSTAGINGSEVVTPALAPLSVVEGGEGNDFIERLHSGDETFGGAGNDWIAGNDDGRFPGIHAAVQGIVAGATNDRVIARFAANIVISTRG